MDLNINKLYFTLFIFFPQVAVPVHYGETPGKTIKCSDPYCI